MGDENWKSTNTNDEELTDTDQRLAPEHRAGKLDPKSQTSSTSFEPDTNTSSEKKRKLEADPPARQSQPHQTVDYAAYGGDPGIARFVWWALALMALVVTLGLVATQCFGSSTANKAASETTASSKTPANPEATKGVPPEGERPQNPEDKKLSSAVEAAVTDASVQGVSASAQGNRVTINGAVTTEAEKLAAQTAAANVPGVASVINKIDINDAAPTGINSGSPKPGTVPSITDPSDPGPSNHLPIDPDEATAAEPNPVEPSFNG